MQAIGVLTLSKQRRMDWNNVYIKKAGLLAKYLEQGLSEVEAEELTIWLQEDPAHEAFLLRLEKNREESLELLAALDVDPAWENVRSRLEPAETKKTFWIRRLLAAATVLLILTYIFYSPLNRDTNTAPSTAKKVLENDVAPGKDKAFLTLDNGSVLVLEELPEGTVQADEGIALIKEKDQLSYLPDGVQTAGPVVYNNLTTPAGGYFRLVLPDSSLVWLNAASSLRFPVRFGIGERRVMLEGEAFFDISTQYRADGSRKNFVVETARGEIEVLGTRFNVLAYADEPASATTLVEGSVRVTSEKQVSKVLKPGQQAVLSDILTVRTVDTDEAIAWKNGYFNFQNRPLPEILRHLQRWYGVEIDITAISANKHFTCSFSRDKPISSVLKMLEQTGEYHFELKNGKIKVTETR